ncbi:MAG: TAXI family TRAP transporter solute-binding subunit [Burkholderiaceae bacterium]|nr:TAXI family TRAP transporter solute-binding subunit [Rhodoferax sp.]MCB2004745.1 TAXI family TRAP transporter solute-binding subunit [Rhodoferax sp.]MCB2041943.1 TAXI family TRAP transporter solute-binding subunit [Rhodoferax sp.]MCP5261138.1 TAXI family TRAP transporter solute-binding subunit [Rhodoferax sp.]MCW5630192.1 TAXI family TRAP transporter solute-binding subunit [Rhodoferax sp.]
MKLNRRLALALVAAAVTVSGAAIAQQRIFFGVATGGTGGTYYPLGGMLAQLISNKAVVDGKKITATAEAAGASVANAKLLGNKDIESAFVAADILDAAYNGKGQFNGAPIKNLRALGALYPETVQLITRADRGINSVKDLKGKSISSGSPGSGQYQLLTDLLTVYGMKRSDIKEDLSSFTQAVDKIKDGNLDATLITAGVPTAAVTDFAQSHDLKVIPLSGAEIGELLKQQPYYTRVQMPANSYKGQTAPVDTLAVMAVWTTHDGVSDAIAYEVTKALYENVAIMGQVHVQGKNISLATATAVGTAPIHPGSLKYFKEKGLVK